MNPYLRIAIFFGVLTVFVAEIAVTVAARQCGCQPRETACVQASCQTATADHHVPTLAPPQRKAAPAVAASVSSLQRGASVIFVTVEVDARGK